MKNYIQIDASGVVIAHLETSGEIDDAAMIETTEGPGVVGYKWNGAGFEPVTVSAAEQARRDLAEIDRKAGMNRLMRETLLALAGVNAPAMLVKHEQDAAAARAKLAGGK